MPCTVMPSPGCSVSGDQPLCFRSSGLSSSTAQLSSCPLASRTFTKMCACGLVQSTSVTNPLMVAGLVSSNFARIEWCAVAVATTSIAAPMDSAASRARAEIDVTTAPLLPRDLEHAGAALALPGAGHGAVVHGQVFDLAVDHVVDDGAGLVLALRLEVQHPPFGVQRGGLD